MMGQKSYSAATVVGLFLDEPWLHVAVCKRDGNGFQVTSAQSFPMSLKFLTGEPELLGSEIRNHLDAMGVREKRCVFGFPSTYALQTRIDLPELQGADLADYLELQIEKEFPRSHDELSIALSRYSDRDERPFAMIQALPLDHVAKLEKVMLAAKLHLESLTIGPVPMAAMLEEKLGVHPCLLVDDRRIELFVKSKGGLVILRVLEELTEEDSIRHGFQHDNIMLELRITLAQIATIVGEAEPRILHLIHSGKGTDNARDMEGVATEALTNWGWKVSRSDYCDAITHPPVGELKSVHPAAWAMVGEWMKNGQSEMEFKPPKVTALEQFISRFTSKSNKWLGTAAALFVVLLGLTFFIQGKRLSHLETQWAGMRSEVESLNEIQDRIRQFRGWFDASCPTLTRASVLAEMFPEQGDVWAKSIEIKSDDQVVCTGFARNREALLAMMERMQKSDEIQDLQYQQVRGENPVQFIVKYLYKGKVGT